ncbi:MAG: DegT/DnrJ/EryC1/StrS family aminotransferase, partial [Bacteroidetes bacterium]|nr:DegT/DnrJ/EryC1/StrS family aminotransferase [Bacteroidota bacterium]
KHAIGVANGSDALFLAVQALKLPKGTEVITTPFTFFASTACIVRNGLKPVFVDVDGDTYHITPDLIEAAITENTSAILAVDLFSHTCDNAGIARVAQKHGLKFIEDAAEAFGMAWNGKMAGALADVSVLSFFPTKTLGCFGDGGAVLTNDDEIATEIRMTRVHGAAKKYHHQYVGINSRLDAIQAAILNVKLDYVADEIAERTKIASWYTEALSGCPAVKLPTIPKAASPVWYVFSIQCELRNDLEKHLSAQGIGTSVYYPVPMHQQECFSDLGYSVGDFPVAERLCQQALALPIYVGMTEREVRYVSEQIKQFFVSR